MPFKLVRSCLLSVSLIGVFFSTGCSYFFNVEKKEFNISYKSESGSCINQVNNFIKNYFDRIHLPLVSEDDLNQFRDCYQKSIESFVRHTKSGRLESENYSAENISLFLKKFFPRVKLSLDNIRYYLKIKHFLIGGQTDTLSKTELLIISDVLTAFTELLKSVLPYRSIYFKKANLQKNEKDYTRYNSAFYVLEKEVNKFLQVFKHYPGDRTVDLRSLIRFIVKQYTGSDSPGSFRYLNMIMVFKNLATISQGDILNRENLEIFIHQAFLTYRELMRFEYFVRENNLFENIGGVVSFFSRILTQLEYGNVLRAITLRSLSDIVESAYQIMFQAIESSPDKRLPYVKIRDLLISLEDAGLLKGQLTANALDLFVEGFSKKWLDPGSEPTADFTISKISYVRNMYSVWFRRQQIVNTLFFDQNRKHISLVDAEKRLRGYIPLERWIGLFKKVSVHQWGDDGRIFFSKKINHFNYEEMTVSNSVAFLSEVFLRPYNLSVDDVHKFKLQRDDIQEIYEILRILGVPLGFMDSRLLESGYRVFNETNNFSTQGRSDEFSDFFEIYEYLSFALSAFQVSEQLYKDINRNCLLDYVDIHGNLVSKASCFRDYLKENFHRFFGHLNVVGRFWEKASDLERNKFLGTVEYIAREGVINETPYKSGEIRTMAISLYYLESVFFTFDYNRDGSVSGYELINAQSHFQVFMNEFLSEKLSQISESGSTVLTYICGIGKNEDMEKINRCLGPKLFLYVLKSGHFPTRSSYGQLKFVYNLVFYDERELFDRIQANAHDVLKFFSMISKDTHESFVNGVKMFLLSHRDSIFSELSGEKSPDCIKPENKNSKFCEWARIIRCNKTVEPYLYQWMKENKYSIFPEKLWNASPEEGVIESMRSFNSTFKFHEKFSVHCFFPDYNGKDDSYTDTKWLVDSFDGDAENGGVKDDLKEMWEDIKDFFGGFSGK